MKKAVVLLILCCAIQLLFGQKASNVISPTQKSKLSLGITFSPAYAFRILENSDGSEIASWVIANRQNNEAGQFGYTAGIKLRYQFLRLLSFETGVAFTQCGFRQKNVSLVNETGDPIPGVVASSKSGFYYLGVPLSLRFSAGKRSLQFYSEVGITASALIFQQSLLTIEYSDGHIDKHKLSWDNTYNRFNLFPFIGLGIEYRYKNLVCKAGPEFSYGILKTSNTPVTAFLWNAGFQIGFYYCFR